VNFNGFVEGFECSSFFTTRDSAGSGVDGCEFDD
jgi:hypothetical protein